MKKIKQIELAKTLNCTQATISRYLSNQREISLRDAIKVSKKHKLPIAVFVDKDLQIKHLGKSFISKDNNNNKSSNT